MSFTLRLPEKISIPMLDGPEEDSFIIPPRAECFRTIKIHNFTEPVLIDPEEISPGIFSSRTLAFTATPTLKIINTTETNLHLRNHKFQTSKLSNYNIFSIDQINKSDERTAELIKILDGNIPNEAKHELYKLISEYQDIFALPKDKMTVNNFYQQKLKICDNSPTYIKNYRTPFSQREEIDRQVKNLQANNLIEPSNSDFNSPLLLVPKKPINGQKAWRMCVDYRAVNRKLIADKWPLPRIEDVLDNLGRAKYFTVLDLFSGFHQVPLHPDSRDITSFSTHNASYRWTVLPFGLKVSPNSFSRMMSLAFSGATALQHFIYMDDIIVVGCTMKHHLKNLKSIFEACRKHHLKLNPLKCNFFKKEVTYLGHICSDKGIFPDPSKLSAVKNYPTPDSKDAVKRLVAFANYYRKFCPHFAQLTKCLNDLTRKRSIFIWQETHQKAFEALKKALISPPILSYPDMGKEFILFVDASKDAVGAALCQKYDDIYKPISYASKCFTKGELNKSTIEKELLAIHFAIKHYRPYLFGTSFTIKSDHKPLTYLFALRDPSSKLTRLRLDIEEYDFIIEHISGKDNIVADALSRIHINDLKLLHERQQYVLTVVTRSMKRNAKHQAQEVSNNRTNDNHIVTRPHAFEPINNEICKKWPILTLPCTEDYNNMFKINLQIKKNRKTMASFEVSVTAEQFLETVLARLEKIADRYNLNECKIYKNDSIFQYKSIAEFKTQANQTLKRLCIAIIKPANKIEDKREQRQIMETFHSHPILGGHRGKRRLLAKIRSNSYWKNMSKDISNFVNNCEKCKINKPKLKTHIPMCLTHTPSRPFECVIIDTVGPLRRTINNNKYIVTLMCDFSKYLVAVPVANKEARTVAQAIVDHLFLIYGPFTKIITDLGTEYNNRLLKNLCQILQVEHNMATPYHHETVGTIERNHRVLNEYLRHYLDTDEWDSLLKYYTYCYNSTPHTSFSFAFTPFELIFGKQVNELKFTDNNKIDPLYNTEDYAQEFRYNLHVAHIHAKTMLEQSKKASKLQYDKRNRIIDLKIGDKVLITNEGAHKLEKLYLGPFAIIDLNDYNVTVNDNSKPKTVHRNRVVKYTI